MATECGKLLKISGETLSTETLSVLLLSDWVELLLSGEEDLLDQGKVLIGSGELEFDGVSSVSSCKENYTNVKFKNFQILSNNSLVSKMDWFFLRIGD